MLAVWVRHPDRVPLPGPDMRQKDEPRAGAQPGTGFDGPVPLPGPRAGRGANYPIRAEPSPRG